jgi:hypothetical protein
MIYWIYPTFETPITPRFKNAISIFSGVKASNENSENLNVSGSNAVCSNFS